MLILEVIRFGQGFVMLQSLCVKKLEFGTATSRPWHLHSTGCKNVFENLTSFNISTRITMSRHFEVQLIIFFFGIIHNFDVIFPLVIWTDKVYLLLAKLWNFETVFTFFSAGWRSGSSRAHTLQSMGKKFLHMPQSRSGLIQESVCEAVLE